MNYSCVSLYSFDSSRKGFVIPAFSLQGSNDIFFQNIGEDGRIEAFVVASTEGLYSVTVLPPAFSLKVGDRGVLAFVDDELMLHIDVRENLAELIDERSSANPITRLEIASLKNDPVLQNMALSDLESLFSSNENYKRWRSREIKFFNKKSLQSFVKSDEQKIFEKKLEEEFSEIETKLDARDWELEWLRLWLQGFDQQRLVGIAFFRQDMSFKFGQFGPEIFSMICKALPWSKEFAGRCDSILKSSSIGDKSWTWLFVRALSSWGGNRVHLLELAEAKLSQWIQDRRGPSAVWVSLWAILRRNAIERRSIIFIGVDYVLSVESVNSTVAREILVPISKYPDQFSRISHIVEDWIIENKKSNLTWVTLFLRAYQDYHANRLIDVGLEWLSRFGGNINAWASVWRNLKEDIGPDEYFSLGMDWLIRARRDMKSWVSVYLELAQNYRRLDSKLLIFLGEDWIYNCNSNSVSRNNIERALSYIKQDML